MLTEEIKKTIFNYDNSRIKKNENEYVISNLNEEITGFVSENKSFYFKQFESSNGNKYVYDAVSNNILLIDDEQVLLLRNPTEEIEFLESLDEKEFSMQKPFDKLNLIEDFTIRTLLINTTEQCNLRCTYCYFSGQYENTRVHNNSKITFSEVKFLIDKFLENQKKLENSRRSIYFFGGEPFINFQLIKDVVLYIYDYSIREKVDISNLIFQIASNGTLIDTNIANFLKEFNIHLNISIDGPNNDEYRVDIGGRGTLDKVTNVLEFLNNKYPKYYSEYVGIACVVTPPYDYKVLYDFFSNWKPAQEALHIGFDLILFNPNSQDSLKELIKVKENLWKLFIQTHEYDENKKDNSWIYFFTTGFNFLHQSFSQVLWRDKTDNSHKVKLNGIKALPGLFISTIGTDGKIYNTFEFQSDNFLIGTITNGLEIKKVDNIISNLHEANNSGSCKTCWAARFCKLDYPDFYISEKDTSQIVQNKLNAKNKRCEIERNDIKLALSSVQTIIENYGEESLGYMYEQKKQYMDLFNSDPWLPYKK